MKGEPALSKIINVFTMALTGSITLGLTLATPVFAATPNSHPSSTAKHMATVPPLHFSKKIAHDAPVSLGQRIVDYAKRYNHTPYSWGGNTPSGFDCSGFTQYVFGAFGINLPHSASGQESLGDYVSKSSLQPGDLVFFNTDGSGVSHVGIYIGDGQFISAASTDVEISSLYLDYWSSTYITARKIS